MTRTFWNESDVNQLESLETMDIWYQVVERASNCANPTHVAFFAQAKKNRQGVTVEVYGTDSASSRMAHQPCTNRKESQTCAARADRCKHGPFLSCTWVQQKGPSSL